MYLTNDNLSIWELAHRMAGSEPSKRYWFGLPSSVKDNLRLLVNEIHHAHLSSSLIMEKWRPDSDMPEQYFIRHHLNHVEDCVAGQRFNRTFLEFVWIDRWEFWRWCQQSDFNPPAFWFEVDYAWPELDDDVEHEDEPEPEPDGAKPLTPRRQLHLDCQRLAVSIWETNPDTPIAQVAQKIQEDGLAAHFKSKTVVSWIRSEAPEAVKGRSGRPKKSQ